MAEFFSIGIFPLILTLAAFRIGQKCQAKWKLPLFNPILVAMILVILFLMVTGMDIGIYKAGASTISWLMTPATISLAISMYEQFQALRKNLKAVVAGVAAGAVTCLVFMTLGGLLLHFDRSIIISLMPKSVTTAIGVALSEEIGGIGAITTAAIAITGIFGNITGPILCRLFGLKDEVAQGVAFGTAAHVIGTAKASEMSELAGAVSSLALTIAGLVTTILLSFLTQFL